VRLCLSSGTPLWRIWFRDRLRDVVIKPGHSLFCIPIQYWSAIRAVPALAR
jgi:hypothetical protein